jgi:heterodisulfide reductase subunit A-like polyferredoxin
VTHSALVLGGGITGMSAALNVADQGYDVYLVEREAELGGNARHIHSTLRNPDVQRMLADMVAQVQTNPRIQVYRNATLQSVDGFVGNFRSTLAVASNGHGPEEVAIDHGVIIVATGAEERRTDAYLRGQDPRVITQRELEEALARGAVALSSDGDNARQRGSVVMIQCVESRTPEHPYCSRVCCSQALKNAIALKTRYPDCDVTVLYRDIRSYGLRERYYQQARDLGVLFVRYDLEPDAGGRGGPPVVERVGERLVVRAYDAVIGEEIVLEPDYLALSVGIGPREDAERLAPMLKAPLNADRFFLEAHMKLRPVEFATEGIFLAGMAHGPKFIEESLSQAAAAVSRACTVLSRDEIVSAGQVAHVDQLACVACGDCAAICPFKAIEVVNKEVTRRNWKDCAEVNPALCKGCGTCAAACRSGCITLDGFDDVQIMAQIAALVSY